MITLHRLAHWDEPFQLNPDLIAMVESVPDTILRLTTGKRVLVEESPEEVADAIREWRASVLAAMTGAMAVAG
ncbi:MAG: flagellar protein FlbD [Thermoleophilaceae bacterium]|jgi:flagellar protein FlbD|nr:flagellar protein FlbD [Thermoleophilaceae bacterium]